MSDEGSDKRTMATDALETLGNLIDDTQRRDAIHLAVEPVVAGEDMDPGDHVTVREGTAWRADKPRNWSNPPLGIVDPFLDRGPRKGQRFWFVMYPRQVRSLRHVWAHPAFPDEAGTSRGAPDAGQDEDEKNDGVLPAALRRDASEKWLREFCSGADCPSYEYVMELIDKGELPSLEIEYYANGGEYTEHHLHFEGRNAHGEIPPEFWDHAEIVLGRKLAQRPAHFTCNC